MDSTGQPEGEFNISYLISCLFTESLPKNKTKKLTKPQALFRLVNIVQFAFPALFEL